MSEPTHPVTGEPLEARPRRSARAIPLAAVVVAVVIGLVGGLAALVVGAVLWGALGPLAALLLAPGVVMWLLVLVGAALMLASVRRTRVTVDADGWLSVAGLRGTRHVRLDELDQVVAPRRRLGRTGLMGWGAPLHLRDRAGRTAVVNAHLLDAERAVLARIAAAARATGAGVDRRAAAVLDRAHPDHAGPAT